MSATTVYPSPIKTSWLLGTLAAFSIFAVIAYISSLITDNYVDYDQKLAIARYATLKKLQADENALLTPVDRDGKPTAEWIDQTKGTVRIPIDEAMAQEVDALKAKTAQMGSEIPGSTPPPAPPVAPTANAAPATATAPAAPKTTGETAAPATKTPPAPAAIKPVPPTPASPNGSHVPATSAAPATTPTPPQPTQ